MMKTDNKINQINQINFNFIKKYDIPILYEDNHLFVCLKKEGILSQADITGDVDMLTIIKEYLKEVYHKEGNVYLGLVHRLDRRVSGVMVFAKSSKAAARLSEDIRLHNFHKKYLAICTGFLDGAGSLKNVLEKDETTKQAKLGNDNDGKVASLDYNVIDHFELDNNIFSVVMVDLHTGRYNQIRKQFALINHPLINDYKYGYSLDNYNNHLGLFCVELKFNHPTTKEEMVFDNFEVEEIKKEWIKYFKGGK